MNRKNYHISIKAIFVKDKKVLVSKKNKNGMEIYDFPGGRIDDGETIEDGLERELKEELNIKSFTLGPLLNAFEWFHYGKKKIGLMVLCYIVDADISNIRLSKEHVKFDWVSKENLSIIPNNSINEGTLKTVEKALG